MFVVFVPAVMWIILIEESDSYVQVQLRYLFPPESLIKMVGCLIILSVC